MLQPQQVTAFPAEHMFTIVHFGLRPNASKHHIRVCACLAAQFAFFSLAQFAIFSRGTTFRFPLNCRQCSVLRLYALHQSGSQECRKLHPLRECPQLKTIPATASTSSSSAGKCYATIETQISTGSLKTILRLCTKILALSPLATVPFGYCSSWWISTSKLLQELNGPVIPKVTNNSRVLRDFVR
jgi:hypothetical protein